MNFDTQAQALLTSSVLPLLRWYDAGHRILPWRSDPTPYHVWVSEIMLQQTRVEAVIAYYERFLSALPTIKDLAYVSQEELLKLWEGLGYYSRVRNLQKAALVLVNEFGGQLPASVDDLLKLPGIGPYSAGAIGSIAFGIAVPAVDGNVLRVVSRITASEENVSQPAVKTLYTKELALIIPADRPGDFNQSLMELGATVCLPNGAPLCGKCPLAHICKAHALGIETALPVKDSKKPRTVLSRTVFILLQGNRVAIKKRPSTGLLAGLWELPGVESRLSDREAAAHLLQIGRFKGISDAGEAIHIFTHREWHMTGYVAFCEQCSDKELTWVTLEQLDQSYCLPSAFRYFYTQIRSLLKGVSEWN